LRYGGPSLDAEAQGLVAIEDFLGASGWARLGGGASTTDSRHLYKFARRGCDKPLFVAMLGTGAETVPLLRQIFRQDLIFFQNGSAVGTPSILRGNLANALHAVLRFAGDSGPANHPIFAVSPAPASGSDPCAQPTISAWVQFLSGSEN
jgi:hypothetical protein